MHGCGLHVVHAQQKSDENGASAGSMKRPGSALGINDNAHVSAAAVSALLAREKQTAY